MLRNKNKSEEAPRVVDRVFDELLASQKKLSASIAAGTEAAVAQTLSEGERRQELIALRGDIQSVLTGMGELATKIDAAIAASSTGDEEIVARLVELENFQRGFSLFIGGELREDMQRTRTVIKEASELLAKALRGWTNAAMVADAQGVDVLKPPGYEL